MAWGGSRAYRRGRSAGGKGDIMRDEEIIELYVQRQERAVTETDQKYGSRLKGLAMGILNSREDSEECVNDTYLAAWNTIPPTIPVYFFAYLAKITRHAAFGRYDYNTAAKRDSRMVEAGRELADCAAVLDGPQEQLESKYVLELLENFLRGLPEEKRKIFLRRYWYFDSIETLSTRYGMSQSKVKSMLFRIRRELKEYLEKEEVHV